MKPSIHVNLNELDKDFVFKVLKRAVCTMDAAEAQLLRGRASQIVNAEGVKQVERSTYQLELLVVIASSSSRSCVVSEKMSQLQEKRNFKMTGCIMCDRHYPRSSRGVGGS